MEVVRRRRDEYRHPQLGEPGEVTQADRIDRGLPRHEDEPPALLEVHMGGPSDEGVREPYREPGDLVHRARDDRHAGRRNRPARDGGGEVGVGVDPVGAGPELLGGHASLFPKDSAAAGAHDEVERGAPLPQGLHDADGDRGPARSADGDHDRRPLAQGGLDAGQPALSPRTGAMIIRAPRGQVGMRRRAAVVGAGHTRFGALNESPRELLRAAVDQAYGSVDKGLTPLDIGEGFLGTLGFSGWQLGNASAVLAEEARITGAPVTRVENACASAGFALRSGILAIESGARDLILVAGVEKMTDAPSRRRRYWLGVSGDTEWERMAGLTFAGVYGLMASAHMREHGTPVEALAEVAVKNHANALKNPNAHLRKAISREEVLASPLVADPLRLFDCCPVSDGAAALLLAGEDVAHRFTDTPVLIAGAGAGSDALALQDRRSMTRLAATRRAADEAFQRAGVERSDVDFLEVHDCFTIAELLALEDLGFAAPGGAAALELSGATRLGGERPVNPDGGLKAKGHPIGATGASQAYEAFVQLRGSAGDRQVRGAETALAHNVGGSGASATVTLFSVG